MRRLDTAGAYAVVRAMGRDCDVDRVQARPEMRRVMELVAHDLNTVKQLCTHTIWLQHGSVVKAGPTQPVVDAYVHSVLLEMAQRQAAAAPPAADTPPPAAAAA